MLLETVRGCRFRCKFCYYPKSYDNLYMLSGEKIEESLRYARQREVDEVSLLDPTLNQRRDFLDFLRLLARNNPDRRFTCTAELRAEGINAQSAALLKEANFTEVEVELQSTDPQAQELMSRKVHLPAFERGVRAMLDAGIRVRTDLILGLPGDTADSIRRGIDYLAGSRLFTDMQVFNLSVLPGTAFRHEAQRLGLSFQARPPYYVLQTPTLDLQQMYLLMEEAQDAFGIEFDPFPPPRLEGRGTRGEGRGTRGEGSEPGRVGPDAGCGNRGMATAKTSGEGRWVRGEGRGTSGREPGRVGPDAGCGNGGVATAKDQWRGTMGEGRGTRGEGSEPGRVGPDAGCGNRGMATAKDEWRGTRDEGVPRADGLQEMIVVDLDGPESAAALPPPERRTQVFTLWLRGRQLDRHRQRAAGVIRRLLDDNPHSTLQVVIQPAAAPYRLALETLEVLQAACFQSASYLDLYYSLHPNRLLATKRLVVVLPRCAAGNRSGLDPAGRRLCQSGLARRAVMRGVAGVARARGAANRQGVFIPLSMRERAVGP